VSCKVVWEVISTRPSCTASSCDRSVPSAEDGWMSISSAILRFSRRIFGISRIARSVGSPSRPFGAATSGRSTTSGRCPWPRTMAGKPASTSAAPAASCTRARRVGEGVCADCPAPGTLLAAHHTACSLQPGTGGGGCGLAPAGQRRFAVLALALARGLGGAAAARAPWALPALNMACSRSPWWIIGLGQGRRLCDRPRSSTDSTSL